MLFAGTKVGLLNAIDRVSRIVKSNPKSVDILQCIKVDSYAGKVYLIAISSMASARVQVAEAVLKSPGSFVVNLDRFKDRVSKAGDQLVLESDDSSLKIVSSSDQRLGLRLNDPREFPDVEWELSDESYGLDQKDLVTLLKKAHSLASSATSLTPAFMQAHLEDRKLWVANGVSYQVFDVECNPALKSSIPTQTLSALSAFIQESGGDTVWLAQMGDENVVVSVGDDQFQTTPLVVTFPNLEPLFSKVKIATSHQLTFQRTALINELSKGKTSADAYGRVTLFMKGVGGTTITVDVKSEAGDWYQGKVPCTWMGTADRTLVFNLEALSKFLQSFSAENITLFVGEDFKGDLSAIYCEEEGHNGIVNQFRI